ncbi:pyocin knob domain-containing protein [Pseudophaeobacter flagellatus]|uniref:pyocin knob domain-containing protein n=1 Tax=Pseudophaeobacter flagellatus TaxID=2899119 RepID=UPI001E3C8F85|nr:pyocin knob domain-containing protein [Pseudophaeobacter flagellatus]MCD9148524.1 pyocin knob domain-containing protein [Pseudophaeobacter flagellatus]
MAAPLAPASPHIPTRSAPEADFDVKMFALFKWATDDFIGFMEAWRSYLETNSTIIGGALNDTKIGLITPRAGAFTALTAASLDGTAVQASPTDPAAGKLLKTGAFGLGAAAAPALVDLDDQSIAVGFYGVNEVTVGTRPDGAANYAMCICTRAGGTGIGQIYINSFNGGMYHRTSVAGTWNAWEKIFTSSTIVGPVSEAVGVPTGAVIMRGSNANGEYVRFADGTQICWKTSLPVGPGATTWTFPAVFGATPVITATGRDVSSARTINIGSVGFTSVDVAAFDASGAAAINNVDLLSIGRWF